MTEKLNHENQQKENNKLKQILINNKYDALTLSKINSRKERKKGKDNLNGKWAKFTHVGKETRFITKLFQNTNVKITFTTDNTIQ